MTVRIEGANDTPTDIELSDNTIAENGSAGDLVGTLSTVDPDAGQSHSYAIGGGTGSALFEIINGNEVACHNRNKVKGSTVVIDTIELYSFGEGGQLSVRYFIRQP